MEREWGEARYAVAPTGRVVLWDDTAEAVFGIPRERALGATMFELIVPEESREREEQHLRRVVEEGAATYETIRLRRDFQAIFVIASLQLAGEASPEETVISISERDVTEVRSLRQAVSLEARFGDLLESLPDAIAIVNRAGRIVLINGQTGRLFGYGRTELAGRGIEILVPERFRAAHAGHRAGYAVDPRSRPMASGLLLFGRRKDGSQFPVEISLGPLETEDGVVVMSAIRDVSERERLRREELRLLSVELEAENRRIAAANRLKSEFVANMSHELRTPLNAIIGFSELLYDGLSGPLTDEQREYLNDIITSSHHLARLISGVLDLAKVESGRMEFASERVDLSLVAKEVADVIRPLANEKRIRLETRIDTALESAVTDAMRLKQVLYNYLSNAIKFTPEGGVVRLRVERSGADAFAVEVEDTGIGIRAGDMHKLFSEFAQLETGSTKRYQGTGLGLALTKRIVEALGGTVGARSEPGRGSTFVATLPLAGAEHAAPPDAVER